MPPRWLTTRELMMAATTAAVVVAAARSAWPRLGLFADLNPVALSVIAIGLPRRRPGPE